MIKLLFNGQRKITYLENYVKVLTCQYIHQNTLFDRG
jgi:hypothetical protein